ncbi:MAG: VOC family protein [Alphaproteobacteria bacterium]|nr:VOC family protein [Alphaproteobacteria bacterium]
MTIQPYLSFSGRAEEAIAFYKEVFGAELQMLLRFKDCPVPIPEGQIAKGWESKVMHASLKIGDSIVMASDGGSPDNAGFKGFSLSYTAKDMAEADRVFAALAKGGTERMPLGKTFFSPRFGMVEDCFGVPWIVIVPAEHQH